MILRRKKKQKKLKEAQQQAALLASLQQGAVVSGNVTPVVPVYNMKRPPSAMSVPIMSYHEGDYDDEDVVSGSDADLEGMIVDSSQQQQQQVVNPVTAASYVQQNSINAGVVSGNSGGEVPIQHPLSTAQQVQYYTTETTGVQSVEYSPSQTLQQQATVTPMPQAAYPPPSATVVQPPIAGSLYQQQQQPIAVQYQQPPITGSVSLQNLSKDQQRKISQPVFTIQEQQQMAASVANIPVSVPTAIVELPLQQQQQIPQAQVPAVQRLNVGMSSGTLRRSRERAAAAEQKKIPPEKAELISTAVSLGLGRGIDATNKMPWLSKASFQVRRVHLSVVETNEGGILMNYNHEVQSIAEVEEQFIASLNPPESTVTICIEDELDRNVSSSRRIVGRRIINRSIGFQADFEEKYKDGELMKIGKDSLLVPKDPAEVVYNTQDSGQTFEERICLWLLHRLAYKCNVTLHKTDENPIEQLAKLVHSKAASNFEKELKDGCQDFVKSLKITHYVTGIQLGAAEYRIMSDGQYHKKMASKGAFGVDSLATLTGASEADKKEMKKKDLMKCSQLRQLGQIVDNHVAKGSHDEVVLQVQVQPITRLIKLPALKSALKGALDKYMEGTPTSEGGPFVIKCTGRDLYLTVNKFNNYEVEATDIPTEASLFYFQTTDDGGNPFEFHIAYYGEDTDPNDQTNSEQSTSVGRYLEAPLSAQGRCPGPLLMKHSVKVKNTRFTLRSRLSKKNNKSHLAEWIAGEDAFYVACATKKYQHGSYLAVKNTKNTGDLIGKHFFMTYCDSTIHSHNGENVMMLFQLCTKEVLLSKGYGRETPGKLPLIATEIDTRKGDSQATALK